MICMLYSFFWVNPQDLNSTCQHFGTLCLFHLHRWCKVDELPTYTQCSETLANKLQLPGNHPKERIQQ